MTGGSRGIGKAIALRFARDGAARVAIGYLRSDAAAEETAERAASARRRAGARPRQRRLGRACSSEVAALGPLDVLVHNAATGVIRPALETEDKHWDWTLNANARALLSLTRVAAPHDAGGIVDRRASRASARSACSRTTRSSAPRRRRSSRSSATSPSSSAPRGIRVNAVSGGVVETGALEHFPNREAMLALGARNPAGRIVTPEDIAGAVAFLCSPGRRHGPRPDARRRRRLLAAAWHRCDVASQASAAARSAGRAGRSMPALTRGRRSAERRLGDHAGHPRVLLQPPQRVLVPLLPERDVDAQRMAGRDELARPALAHAQQHLELVGLGRAATPLAQATRRADARRASRSRPCSRPRAAPRDTRRRRAETSSSPGTRSRPARRRCPCRSGRWAAGRQRPSMSVSVRFRYACRTIADVLETLARAARGRARSVSSTQVASSMSIRTKRAAARGIAHEALEQRRGRGRGRASSPSPVSLTETFASSRSPAIAASTSSYAAAIACASAALWISSPRTSTVARFPLGVQGDDGAACIVQRRPGDVRAPRRAGRPSEGRSEARQRRRGRRGPRGRECTPRPAAVRA